MRINADFSKPAFVKPDAWTWRPSPMAGVERIMLDRIGEEVARATSIVRYAPDSHFSTHVHGGGEEFLVLQGSFHDAHGDYPTGTYVRNPIGTSHAPWAGPDGTIIFVKLHQFDERDVKQFGVQAFSGTAQVAPIDARLSRQLHQFKDEVVSIEILPAGVSMALEQDAGGHEILVLSGSLDFEGENYPKNSWLRFPPGHIAALIAGQIGAEIYLKSGHLG